MRNEFLANKRDLKNIEGRQHVFVCEDLTPLRYKLLKYMQKSCSDTFISCYTRNGNKKAKLKTTEKWVTVTSPDDTFKHGIYVDYVQMGCYATEYKSKPARNVHLSTIYGIIALKQKRPTWRLKCLVRNITKTNSAQPIRPVRPWPNAFSDSTIRFSFKKQLVHTAADINCKTQINCSLLYSKIHRPVQFHPSFMHGGWILN